MVYDGVTFKFYRDGFLINQTSASGNLLSNTNITSIGLNEFTNVVSALSNFVGNINEVRIWNVARTQAQIIASMNGSLSNPTTQPGLLAYYTFGNLLNKQGNSAWDGTLNGSASINAVNPNCTSIILDSCNIPVTLQPCTPYFSKTLWRQ
ncbi:MAG: LamG-like jellyroll fold domain-containing protein [Ferruginibacter sp.]